MNWSLIERFDLVKLFFVGFSPAQVYANKHTNHSCSQFKFSLIYAPESRKIENLRCAASREVMSADNIAHILYIKILK